MTGRKWLSAQTFEIRREPQLGVAQVFQGRVTSYLAQELPPARNDFYLGGSSEMVRDVMGILDERFSESRVFTETFFSPLSSF